MSLLIPAVAASALWWYGAKAIDLQQKAREDYDLATQRPDKKAPFQGHYTSFGERSVSDNRLFESVEMDYDANGAPIFLVDYGSGSRTIQYHDPRIMY